MSLLDDRRKSLAGVVCSGGDGGGERVWGGGAVGVGGDLGRSACLTRGVAKCLIIYMLFFFFFFLFVFFHFFNVYFFFALGEGLFCFFLSREG